MGQSHPTGANVVCARETGGGKDCDCGAPRFHVPQDARLLAVVSQEEVHQKFNQVNEDLKRGSLLA